MVNVLPVWSKQYFDSVVSARHNRVPAFKAVQKIEVSEEMKKKLLEHDFVSKAKKNSRSVWVEQKVQPYRERDVKLKMRIPNIHCKADADEVIPGIVWNPKNSIF